MSDQNDATENPPTEGPPEFVPVMKRHNKVRYLPREHPIQVLFDEVTLDTIEEARQYQRPSDGKVVSEPRSTFIYNIVKSHLAEKCPNCGEPLMKRCPRCYIEADVIPYREE